MAARAAEAAPVTDITSVELGTVTRMAPNYAEASAPVRSSGSIEHLQSGKPQPWPKIAPPASSEHIQSYFAQLSDIQQMLSQRATLAAQLGSSAAAAAAKVPPPSVAAAAQHLSALNTAMHADSASAHAAAVLKSKTSRKRRKHNEVLKNAAGKHASIVDSAAQQNDDFDTAAAVAGALFSSAADDMLNSRLLQQDPVHMTNSTVQQLDAVASGEAWRVAAVPGNSSSSSYKGVEYLTAERKWQAYVVDHAITEVVWLDKYDTAWEAAQAHDRELIRRVGATQAAPLLNFHSSLSSSNSSGDGGDSSSHMRMWAMPLEVPLQDIRASTAESAGVGAVLMQLNAFSSRDNVSVLQPPTLLPLPEVQSLAGATADTTAAAAAAFNSFDFGSSFSAPVLAPPLPLTVNDLAAEASHAGGFMQYNSDSTGVLMPPPPPAVVAGNGATTAPQPLGFNAFDSPAPTSTSLTPVVSRAAGVPAYRIGTMQVTTPGPAAAAAATTDAPGSVPQWPIQASAVQAAMSAEAGVNAYAAATGQPGSMMALLVSAAPAAAAAAVGGQIGSNSSTDAGQSPQPLPLLTGQQGNGSWVVLQQHGVKTSAGMGAGAAVHTSLAQPQVLVSSMGQHSSGGWTCQGLPSLLPSPAAAGQQVSSGLVPLLPTGPGPLGSGSSYTTNAGMQLPVPPHIANADQGPTRISTMDVLMAAGGSSSSTCALPGTPMAHAACSGVAPCSPPAAAAAAATSAALSPESAAAWAASHIAAAEAVVPASQYKGVEYLPAQQKWQAYAVDPVLSEVVFLGTYDTELEAAHAHDRELMQRMGAAAAAAHLNFVSATTAQETTQKPTFEAPRGAQQQQQQQQQQQSSKPDPNSSSALAALAEGPAMAAAMAAVASRSGHDSAAIMQIAQAAAAAAAAAAGAAAAASLAAAGDAVNSSSSKERGSKAGGGTSRGRRRGAAAGGGSKDAKPVSQYKGVSWSASCSKWVAVIWDRVQRKARHLGVFEEEEAAAVAYDKEVVATQGAKNTGLNFRDRLQTYQEALGISPQDDAAAAPTAAAGTDGGLGKGKPHSSSYRGISWHDRSKRWEARAWGAGRQHFVGSFVNEVDAARAYDRAILKLGGPGPKSSSRLNFPLSEYDMSVIEAMEFPAAAGAAHPGKVLSVKRLPKRARSSEEHDSGDGDE